MAEAHFKKSGGIFTATIKRKELSVQISFRCDDSANEDEIEEGLRLLHAVLVLICGEDEAAGVFLRLSTEMEK